MACALAAGALLWSTEVGAAAQELEAAAQQAVDSLTATSELLRIRVARGELDGGGQRQGMRAAVLALAAGDDDSAALAAVRQARLAAGRGLLDDLRQSIGAARWPADRPAAEYEEVARARWEPAVASLDALAAAGLDLGDTLAAAAEALGWTRGRLGDGGVFAGIEEDVEAAFRDLLAARRPPSLPGTAGTSATGGGPIAPPAPPGGPAMPPPPPPSASGSPLQLGPCPRSFTPHAERGETIACTCSADAAAAGAVWGTDVYTADSTICRAAIHAGAIAAVGGRVVVRPLPGRLRYEPTRRNGVESSSWGDYPRSFAIAAAGGPGATTPGPPGGEPTGARHVGACPGSFTPFAERGETIACTCSAAAAAAGSLWGTDVYTADSTICRAALHAGAISPAGGGVVVRPLPGRPRYDSTRRNGVQSSGWGAHPRSFTVSASGGGGR